MLHIWQNGRHIIALGAGQWTRFSMAAEGVLYVYKDDTIVFVGVNCAVSR